MLKGIRKVLIIDDEASFCEAIRSNLESLGNFSVEIATNGRDGLKLAASYQPDIILLDLMLPQIGGLEILRRLKGDHKTLPIPVIILSAVTDEKTKQTTSSLYGEYYLEKPVSTEKLKATIEGVFSRYGE